MTKTYMLGYRRRGGRLMYYVWFEAGDTDDGRVIATRLLEEIRYPWASIRLVYMTDGETLMRADK